MLQLLLTSLAEELIVVSRRQSSKSSLLCKIAVLFPPSHAHCMTLYSRIENSNAHLRRSLGFCLSRMVSIEPFSISRLQNHARSRPDQSISTRLLRALDPTKHSQGTRIY
jgi:hypothetical protein